VGIVPTGSINLAISPHPKCKFALLITEGGLQTLSFEELQAALAHELGHVELGHFAARQDRQRSEQRTDHAIESAGAVGSATAGAIPGVGPIIAVGVLGAQLIAHFTSKGSFRAYDREEETAADRFAVSLLEKVLPGRCRALLELFQRMQREATSPPWTSWLSTHPSLGSRLDDTASDCPSS
jgi:predicted Zn-dependent protease